MFVLALCHTLRLPTTATKESSQFVSMLCLQQGEAGNFRGRTQCLASFTYLIGSVFSFVCLWKRTNKAVRGLECKFRCELDARWAKATQRPP